MATVKYSQSTKNSILDLVNSEFSRVRILLLLIIFMLSSLMYLTHMQETRYYENYISQNNISPNLMKLPQKTSTSEVGTNIDTEVQQLDSLNSQSSINDADTNVVSDQDLGL